MAEADIARLKAIGRQIWQRHFDDRLGLSAAEMLRLSTVPVRPLPANEPLLADRPEHIVPWGTRKPPVEAGNPANRWGFDMVLPPYEAHLGELHNLSIQRGTLTAEDRFKINITSCRPSSCSAVCRFRRTWRACRRLLGHTMRSWTAPATRGA